MSSSFQRGLTVCDMVLSPDGWDWLAFVAVGDDHPIHGRRFVWLKSGHTLEHVAHATGVSSHDAKWWFIIDTCGCPDEDAALLRLLVVSDELSRTP